MGRTSGPANGAPTTLAARLTAAREQAFVGRSAELDLLRDALAGETPPFAVLHLHGPGGVGKTALLQRFAREARAAGREAIVVDGHAVEASPAAFEAAVGKHIGDRAVLLIDTYEALTPLDAWLRERFLPPLPVGALVVVAGRRPPLSAWREDPGWHELLRVVEMRNLDPDDSRALLAGRGVPPALHDDVVRFTGGHPLALTLMADVVAEQGADAALEPDRTVDVVRELVDRFARQVPSEHHRAALEVCAIARTTTEPLLRQTLPDAPARELLDWLCELSFVELAPDGVFPHDLAREALDAELRWRDPDRYLQLNMAIISAWARRAAAATGTERERAQLELLHAQYRSPALRPFFRPEATRETRLQRAGPGDRATILALAREVEGAESAAIAEHWLGRREADFMLLRSASDADPIGFLAALLLETPREEESGVDPVVAAAWNHVRRHAPLRAGERIDIMRFWVERAGHQTVDNHHLVAMRSSLDWSYTPGLAWSFAIVADPEFWEPMFTHIDFHRAHDAEATVGGRRYGAFAHDWRAVPRSRWGKLLRERQLSGAIEDATPAAAQPALAVLSESEFAAAVRDALRAYRRPAALEANPLLRARLVRDGRADAAPADRLRALLDEAAATLRGHPRDEKLYRALEATYLRPAPTQEAAAERLGLPFSTYRRHLNAGVERVAGWLWQRELRGA
jgi:AAA ATPase-like protein